MLSLKVYYESCGQDKAEGGRRVTALTLQGDGQTQGHLLSPLLATSQHTLLLLWQTEYINFEASDKNIWSDGQHNRTVGRTGRPCAVGRTAADDETKKAKHLTETRSLCSTLQVMWRLYRLDLLTLHHSEPGGPVCRRISLIFSVCENLG